MHDIVIILKSKQLVMTPWELTVLETTVGWTEKAWTSCVSDFAFLRLSGKVYCYLSTVERQRNDHGSASGRPSLIIT